MPVSVVLPGTTGGSSWITVSFECQRSGGSNDQAKVRILRRVNGQGDVALSPEPYFVLTSDRQLMSWTWIDPNVPFDTEYVYVLQMNRVGGAGTFFNLIMTGVHYKK